MDFFGVYGEQLVTPNSHIYSFVLVLRSSLDIVFVISRFYKIMISLCKSENYQFLVGGRVAHNCHALIVCRSYSRVLMLTLILSCWCKRSERSVIFLNIKYTFLYYQISTQCNTTKKCVSHETNQLSKEYQFVFTYAGKQNWLCFYNCYYNISICRVRSSILH